MKMILIFLRKSIKDTLKNSLTVSFDMYVNRYDSYKKIFDGIYLYKILNVFYL